MRRKTQLKIVAAIAVSSVSLHFTSYSKAASGTWTLLSSGNATGTWSTAANWNGNIIADGAGNTADFSTLNITANSTVTLDSSRSIGTLKFQDATTSSNTWTLNSSNSSILTLDNTGGTGQPTIDVLNQTLTINAPLAGSNGFNKIDTGTLVLTASNALSGNVLLSRGDTNAQNSSAFGTSTITINPGSNNARIFLNSGINLSNTIVMTTSNSGSGTNGTIFSNGAFDNILSGPVTISGGATSGGHFLGATGTNYLRLTNTLTDTLPANFVSLTNSGNGIVIRQGNLALSGGGSYFRIDNRLGTLLVAANNGIATNAFVDMGGNGTSTLDLGGFNQSLVAVTNFINARTSNVITNSNTSSPSTLTLTPNPSSYSIPTFTNTSYVGSITDASSSAPLNIVVNSALNPNSGDNTGIITFSNTTNSYDGSTNLASGTLVVPMLNSGGSTSSIGQSSNAASNLVFAGGVLQYSGSNGSTDRNFTIMPGTTGTFNVSTGAAVLTVSGGSAATTGALVKTGPGTLLLSGSNQHTGPTTVGAGTLLVTGSLASGSNVSISANAILGGTGPINGTVTPASGGIIAPGVSTTNSGVGTLSVGALTLNTGSVLNFELTSGSGNDEITVNNSGGLTINGGSLDLYQPGTTTTFSTNGTYPLFNFTGSIAGALSNLSVATPAAGKVYSFTTASGLVSLNIGQATTIEWNGNAGDTNWGTGGNWFGGTQANAVGQSALFGVNSSSGTVNVNGTKTVSGIIFNSGPSYALGGSGSLILDNGVASAAVDVVNGQHTISVPITLNGPTALDTTNSSDQLNLNGNITGAKAVTVNGPGVVTLTGSNSFTSMTVNGGTLNVGAGTTGTLGTGGTTLTAGAILNFNNNAANYNYGQPITATIGSGSVNQIGPGTTSVGAISGVTTVASTAGMLVVTGGISQSAGVNVTGSGSLNVSSGGISGAGALTVNTSGLVTLTGASTYAGGTTLTAGGITLGASSTLPVNSSLEVDGGTLDLHGNSITVANILDMTSSTGVITNNGPAASTSTYAFGGNQTSYNLYAALNDGVNGGKVALTSNIATTFLNSGYTLHSHSTGNFSGGTTVAGQIIEADATNAFGTGPITLLVNNSSVNNEYLQVVGGITLSNNIILNQPNSGVGLGAINYLTSTTGSTTLTGTITQNADAFAGGTFAGPTAAGDVLNINGPVNTAGTATTIVVRAGNVGFGGGGSYPNLQLWSKALVNAPNGISTSAAVTFQNTGATLDLTGKNQTVAGLAVAAGASGQVTNSSATAATFTVNTAVASNYAGGIITGNLSLVKSGASSLFLSGSNGYTGGTTISGGTLRLGPISQPSLVAAYSFDNTTNTPVGTPTTIVNSGSGGAAMNGTVNGTGVTIVSGGPVINGVSGNALNFNTSVGTGSVLINSPITDLSGAGTWSVSGWVNTMTTGSTLFTKLNSTTTWVAGNSTFYLSDGGASGSTGTEPAAVRNSGGWITGSQAVSDGSWHMVTYVDSGGTKTIYVDGTAVALATGTNQGLFNNTDVGTLVQLGLASTAEADGEVALNGSIDDLNFFSGALSQAQITSLFSTNNAGAFPVVTVLPATSVVNITASGAALDINGNAQPIASLAGVAGSQVFLGGGTLTVGDSTSTTFAGSITDAGGASSGTGGSLIKQGSGTLTLSGNNSYSGGTVINAGLLIAGNGLSSVGTGGIVVNAGGMILRSTSAGTVNGMLQTGFNTGKWNGSGGITSATATSDSTHLHAVGMLQPSTATTFEGQSLGTGDVALKYTYYGDATLDGKVDGSDYSRIDSTFLTEKTTSTSISGWYNGDFNYDNVVNGSDYTLIDNAYNSQGAAIASLIASPSATATAEVAGSGTSSAVPEPTALSFLGLGAAGLLGRRRRS